MRETEKTFHLLVHYSNGCRGRREASSKPGASSFSQVPHLGGRPKNFHPVTFTRQRHRTGLEAQHPGRQLVPRGDASAAGARLASHAMALDPILTF